MKIFLLSIFAIFVLNILNSEAYDFIPIDYDEIQQAINDSSSQYFYPLLYERFENYDSTFTLEELRHLYYGYSFMEAYNPFIVSDEIDSLQFYLSKPYLSNNDFLQVIKFSEKHLKKYPFDTNVMSYLFQAYERTGNLEMRDKTTSKIFAIVDAIMSSGNGIDADSPLHVIFVPHEYLILEIMELAFTGEQALADEYIDFLEVKPNDREIRGVYFDKQQSMKALRKRYHNLVEPNK